MFGKFIFLFGILTVVYSSSCTATLETEEIDLAKAPSALEIMNECELALTEVTSWRAQISFNPPQEFGGTEWERMEWEFVAYGEIQHVITVMTDGRQREGYIWSGNYRCDRWDEGSWEITAPLAKGSGRPYQELLFEQIFGGAEDLALTGVETAKDEFCYILEHTRPAGEYGDAHFPSTKIKVWIDVDSYLPLKQTIESEETTSTIEYYDYNAPISIEMPVAAPADLAPTAEATLLPVAFFSQRNKDWSHHKMGGDGPTIMDKGCALTSAAMVMAYYNVDTDPGRLNGVIGTDGYDNEYNLKWPALSKACQTEQNQIRFEALVGGTWDQLSSRLDQELEAGYPVIAWVKGTKTSSHFIVFRGQIGGKYHFYDPWDEYAVDRTWPNGHPDSGMYELKGLRIYHGIVSPTPSTAIIKISSAWVSTIPTVDGILSDGEWDEAARVMFTLSTPEPHNCSLYVKNDEQKLYLLVVIEAEEYDAFPPEGGPSDSLSIQFDNDNDGVIWTVGDDCLFMRGDGGFIYDGFRRPDHGWGPDDSDHGTNDIVAAVTHTNPSAIGNYTFEFLHPLNTVDDTHDFSLSVGETVGFKINYGDGASPGTYHAFWPNRNGTCGQIILAEPTISSP